MLTVLKTKSGISVLGVSDAEALIVVKNKSGVSIDTASAGTVYKAYKDAEQVIILPVKKTADDEDYALPEKKLYPVGTEEHARAALSLFHAHRWSVDDDKKAAAGRMVRAAKKFGIRVDPDSEVARAAKGG